MSILWPLTFYSDPALAYCACWAKIGKIDVNRTLANFQNDLLMVNKKADFLL
jgi:hypothetical protein